MICFQPRLYLHKEIYMHHAVVCDLLSLLLLLLLLLLLPRGLGSSTPLH